MNEQFTLIEGCLVHLSEVGFYGFYYKSDLSIPMIRKITVSKDTSSFADRRDPDYILVSLPHDIAHEMRLPSNRVWVHKDRI